TRLRQDHAPLLPHRPLCGNERSSEPSGVPLRRRILRYYRRLAQSRRRRGAEYSLIDSAARAPRGEGVGLAEEPERESVSAMGHKRTWASRPVMSGLGPKADMFSVGIDVCKVRKRTSTPTSQRPNG